MSEQNFQAGGEVDAKCGRCKEVRGHVIIAMAKGVPARVECLACHSVHNYHPPVYIRTVSPGQRPIRPTADKRRSPGAILSAENAVDYSPKEKYKVGMVIRHARFGLGLVDRVEPRKITVIFGREKHYLIMVP